MRNWGDALAHTGPNFGVFEDEPRAAMAAKLLTKDEARRIAANNRQAAGAIAQAMKLKNEAVWGDGLVADAFFGPNAVYRFAGRGRHVRIVIGRRLWPNGVDELRQSGTRLCELLTFDCVLHLQKIIAAIIKRDRPFLGRGRCESFV